MSHNRRIEEGYKKLKYVNQGGIFLAHQKKSIYFAHPFDRWQSKREGMIEQILEQRGYKVVNPFTEENRLNKKYGVENYYQNPCDEFSQDIVDKDWDMVVDCESYFGWFPKGVAMIGTPIELVWALLLGKEIITLTYKPHPFLKMFSDTMYVSYNDFIEDKPLPIKKRTYDLITKLLLELNKKRDDVNGILV